jgi:hypothetical protein
MALNSLQDYDEVTGILKISAYIILYWTDTSIQLSTT